MNINSTEIFNHDNSTGLRHSKTLTTMKTILDFCPVLEFLLVNSVTRQLFSLMAAGFEEVYLSSFLYLLMRSLTIFGSAAK